jgi:hypothetical protein
VIAARNQAPQAERRAAPSPDDESAMPELIALRKIGGFGFGSHLAHPGRAELSHISSAPGSRRGTRPICSARTLRSRRQARTRYSRLSGLEREVACVPSVFAHFGGGDLEAARKAFGKAPHPSCASVRVT